MLEGIVGHAFPTCVTPRVHVEIGQEDSRGRMIAATIERPCDPRAVTVAFRVTVEPDAFYADFYRAVLSDPAYAKGRAALREALKRAEASPYDLYRSRQPLH
jgi:hypothetical protein